MIYIEKILREEPNGFLVLSVVAGKYRARVGIHPRWPSTNSVAGGGPLGRAPVEQVRRFVEAWLRH